MTETIFNNIESIIINELMLARKSIKIAVAWFNSQSILDVLCWKLKGGVKIEMILHYDLINSGKENSLDFNEYKRLGGTLIWAKSEKSTMHLKYCILDETIVLHGSCNWTYRGFNQNDEGHNITRNEPEMVGTYLNHFNSLKNKYSKFQKTTQLPPICNNVSKGKLLSKEERVQALPMEEKILPMHYIWQPYPISAIQADLSHQQIRVLVGMMASVQNSVQQMFDNNKGSRPLLLFPNLGPSERVHVDFRFSDVVDRPDAYRDVEKVVNKFMQMVFRYEDKEKGEVTLPCFIDEITYPSRGRRREKIRFTFTREQAQTVFNFTRYSRYMSSVASSTESKYTARIYMLITSARGFDRNGIGVYHWYVGYEDLRRILGCDDKDDNGLWYRKHHIQYKHFKADVLNTAKSELKRLADSGKADCWFDVTELPKGFNGDPQRFDFTVHLINVETSAVAKVAPLEPEPFIENSL